MQELAFTLRDGLEYVEWVVRAGMSVDEFAPRLSFFFNAHNDLFEEVAKYRAARKVWARAVATRGKSIAMIQVPHVDAERAFQDRDKLATKIDY